MTITVDSDSIDYTGGSYPLSSARRIVSPVGDAPMYAARAWALFDGLNTANGASCYIYRAGNISSIVRNSSGNYTVNMSTAMPDANYCVLAHGGNGTGPGRIMAAYAYAAPTSSQFTVRVQDSGGTLQNPLFGSITVIR